MLTDIAFYNVSSTFATLNMNTQEYRQFIPKLDNLIIQRSLVTD